MKNSLKIIGVVIGAIIIISVASVAYMYHVGFDNLFKYRSFEQSIWVEFHNNPEPDNPRGEMYEDLTRNYLKIGMMKQDVMSLLGEADYESEEYFLSYNLGASALSVDYDSLDIKFSNDYELISFRRVQH